MADIRIGALPEVCDACLAQSVDHISTDNGPGFEDAVRYCVGQGATMDGHRCERQESDGEIWCNCQCNHAWQAEFPACRIIKFWRRYN